MNPLDPSELALLAKLVREGRLEMIDVQADIRECSVRDGLPRLILTVADREAEIGCLRAEVVDLDKRETEALELYRRCRDRLEGEAKRYREALQRIDSGYLDELYLGKESFRDIVRNALSGSSDAKQCPLCDGEGKVEIWGGPKTGQTVPCPDCQPG